MCNRLLAVESESFYLGPVRTVQRNDFPDFIDEILGGVGLLKEFVVRAVFEAGFDEDVPRIPRGEDDRGVRMLLREMFVKFRAVHFGHDDIREEDIDLAIELIG